MTTVLGTGGAGQGNSVTGTSDIGAASGANLNPPVAEPAKKKVLVVDDDPGITGLFNIALRKDYDVTLAANAIDAESKLAAGFDLVVCDNTMGGEKGIDFLIRIKPNHPNTKFALNSSELEKDPTLDQDPGLRASCIQHGIIPSPKLQYKEMKPFVDGIFTSWVGETPTSQASRPTTDDPATPFPAKEEVN
jgi:CheY-like chemotaxis protein